MAASAERLDEERKTLVLMDSTRPTPTFLTALNCPIVAGGDTYSSKKELAFLQSYSDAGLVAGVFFDHGPSYLMSPC